MINNIWDLKINSFEFRRYGNCWPNQTKRDYENSLKRTARKRKAADASIDGPTIKRRTNNCRQKEIRC